MVRLNWTRIIFGGLVATTVMTVLMLMAPAMGLPPMNVGAMLGSVMGGSLFLGWMAHFVIGTMLAIIYATLFAARLPGPGFLRGAPYGLAPWIVAQLVIMPMMGAGVFGGSFGAGFGSLMGHLVYGAVLGGIYGTSEASNEATRRGGVVADFEASGTPLIAKGFIQTEKGCDLPGPKRRTPEVTGGLGTTGAGKGI